MKVLSEYRFKNEKAIRVRYLNPSDQKRLGVPTCDTMALCFEDSGSERRTYIRPDEAVIMIRLLSDAVFKSVKGYEVGLSRTDGFVT